MQENKKTSIIITGCQRSGTTLTHLIMDSHPEIAGIDERQFHYPSINTYLHAYGVPPFISFKLPQYAPLLSFLRSFPNVKIIWCIRDPMDVMWSMMKLKTRLNQNLSVPWAAHPQCAQAEIINSYWSLNKTTRQKLSGHMNSFQKIANKNPWDRSRSECIFTGALCWAIKNTLPELYRQENIDFHTLKYEKLVTSPKDTIKSVLDYIGIKWSDDVLKHHEKQTGTSIGDTSNTRPIDSKGVGQGIANFKPEEADQIREVCSEIANHWEYNL